MQDDPKDHAMTDAPEVGIHPMTHTLVEEIAEAIWKRRYPERASMWPLELSDGRDGQAWGCLQDAQAAVEVVERWTVGDEK